MSTGRTKTTRQGPLRIQLSGAEVCVGRRRLGGVQEQHGPRAGGGSLARAQAGKSGREAAVGQQHAGERHAGLAASWLSSWAATAFGRSRAG
jgi:hypothetical protein